MKKTLSVLILLLILLGLQACSKNRPAWTSWRGPVGDGTSGEMLWSVDKISESWRFNVGKGHSAVVSNGKYCYSQGNKMSIVDGDTLEEEYVYCLDARTGKEIWHQKYPCKAEGWPGPGATPLIYKDKVYTIGRQAKVLCLDAANGDIEWERDLVADSLAPKHLYAGSPVVVGDVLLLNVNKAGTGLDKNTGETIWTSQKGVSQFGTPIIKMIQGKEAAILGIGKKLVAFDVQTGDTLWHTDFTSACAPPLLLGDKLFCSDRHAALYQLNDEGATLLWEKKKLGRAFQTFVALDGFAYGFTSVNRKSQPLTCIDLATGEEKWRQELGRWGALSLSDGKLVILTGDGQFVVAEASPEAYNELHRSNGVTMHDNEGIKDMKGCFCWTNPSIADGRLYLRNNYGDITCFSVD
ncbi:PQQ-like beta-propeller repeat protein [bacterium]|nr:PQQ-like beta-propeller repeat protein [bacterium]